MKTKTVIVIGGGVIGGSICLRLKKSPEYYVRCIDLPEKVSSLEEAKIAHEVLSGLDSLKILPENSILILATSVECILSLMDQILPYLKKGTIITDVGSTKVEIVRKAQSLFSSDIPFIGGHPMAGSEQKGLEGMDPLLFQNRVYVLCPLEETPPQALLSVMDLVEKLGATPLTLDPKEHDEIMASISHLPQLLAMGLMQVALEEKQKHELLPSVFGQGFLDMTRIASSDFEVWKSILKTNQASIRLALDHFTEQIQTLKKNLEGDQLETFWKKVSQERRKLTVETRSLKRKMDLRQLVDRQDERILKEIAQRFKWILKIGIIKKDQAQGVLDPQREKELIEERKKWGQSLGLSSKLVEELFSVILSHSRNLQEKLK